jgi:adenylate cyclase
MPVTKAPEPSRKLIAVLYADMAGYSRLIGLDDGATLERLRALRRDLIDPAIQEHGGRIVQTGGDSLLVAFDSIDGAVRCAVRVQQQVPIQDGEQPADRAIRFRVGINIGDTIADGTDLHGDAVNVAARLQAECPPGGICVSRSVRDHVHGRLDLEFEALGTLKLKNISRPVEAFLVRIGEATRAKPFKEPDAPPLPDRPSIAVLPFQNMSGDPEQEYFADGMVEEIITTLSRIRWLFVIARNSGFIYKGQTVDVKQVGHELGVRYVLEGSVRKSGNRVRITSQLIEAETNAHLWADRFDGSIEDVFDLQDQVAIGVAGAIEPVLQAAEIQRSNRRPTSDVTAYDLYLRARPLLEQAGDRELTLAAIDLLGRAVQRDPDYGPALALLAVSHLRLDLHGWTTEPSTNRARAIELIRAALRCSPDDPAVLSNAAFVLGYFGEDLDAAIRFSDRAIELNPSFAQGWYWSGVLRNWAGRPDVALERFATYLRLSPRERFPYHLTGMGIALFLCERFAEAVAKLRESLELRPSHLLTYRFLAAAYACMGRIDDAHDVIAELRLRTPNLLESGSRLRDPKQRELYLSGLRMAMGPAPK